MTKYVKSNHNAKIVYRDQEVTLFSLDQSSVTLEIGGQTRLATADDLKVAPLEYVHSNGDVEVLLSAINRGQLDEALTEGLIQQK
ncbi:MAG: hypothetical protein LBT37_04085 [Lactobacillaceae bacterium]|jgi:hypothetical protein|nr:hypothetical protein [Lactobacillaceae bacterium]